MQRRPILTVSVLALLLGAYSNPLEAAELDRTGTQWAPVMEWELSNASIEGNPFDLIASATFVHAESGEKRTTGMFYDGEGTWKFRFTATRPGKWTFTTSSADSDLNGKQGTVTVKPNPDAYGFVTHVGNRWARPKGASGELEGFVPQFAMYHSPDELAENPDMIDGHIDLAMREHGFTGFHTGVACRWFDIEHERSNEIDDNNPNPDPRTFEILETLIHKTHAAGGVVHLWAWGDDSRNQTPVKWGVNGKVDQRLQRYIAARLGPLPGWTMGYGFDLWEWTDDEMLTTWHDHMHAHFGWPHMLGARSSKNKLDQISEAMDYSSYEQHRPDYAMYVKTIETRPSKPSFSEDRFRIRRSRYPEKDYDMQRTRHGLWDSAMAGGVANIWGYLMDDRREHRRYGPSFPFPEPHLIHTYAEFFRGRFLLELVRDNSLTDGVCLRHADGSHYLFYKDDTDSIRVDLSQMPGEQPAVAVDALKPYKEIPISLRASDQTWRAPYRSAWAVAVGRFGSR